MGIEATCWELQEAGRPLACVTRTLADPGHDEVLVEIIANGMCHTDLGFWDGSVKCNKALPLVLGHEAVGRVVAAGEGATGWLDRLVIVPAVLPCGDCAFCEAGRGNACLEQLMPGNDIDGAFATHMLVPAAPLVPVLDPPAGFDVRLLSVVADAVSTAYQAVRRADLQEGDLAVVVGAGGVGGFLVQIAAALGARVVAMDVAQHRLDLLREHGAEATVSLQGLDARDGRRALREVTRGWGISSLRTKIFECAGVGAAQAQAYTLLARGSVMVQVGFSRDKTELRLGNLMAFDATVHGTWGCPPEVYPEVLELIFAGKVAIAPFVEFAPMAEVNRVLDDMAHHRLTRRVILEN
jgi:6-hydroxycyclohex-1-ene-1-carbonyl-CoA dehydrogenase